MLTWFYANNYKSLVNFRIDFQQANVLIGKNGGGKSTIIHALRLLREFILGGKRASELFSVASLTRWMKSNVQTFEFGIDLKGQLFTYHLELEHLPKSGECLVLSEWVKCEEQEIFAAQKGTVDYNDPLTGRQIEFRVDRSFSGVSYVADGAGISELSVFKQTVYALIIGSIDPLKMLDAVQTEAELPDAGFTNIGAVVSFLAQTGPAVLPRLWEQLQEIDPSFVQNRIEMGPFGKRLVVDYRYHDVTVTYQLSELSEGERVLMALYLLLFGFIQQGYTVLIDEPDNYISLREVQPWCVAVEDACRESGGQCIMISHHPEVIDYFGGSSGIWVKRLASGESVINQLPKNAGENGFLKYSELIAGGYLDEIE